MEDVYFFRAPSPLPLPAGGLLVWIGPRPLTGEGNGGGGGMSSTATRRRSSSVTGERLPSAVSETPKGAGPPPIQPPNRRGVGIRPRLGRGGGPVVRSPSLRAVPANRIHCPPPRTPSDALPLSIPGFIYRCIMLTFPPPLALAFAADLEGVLASTRPKAWRPRRDADRGTAVPSADGGGGSAAGRLAVAEVILGLGGGGIGRGGCGQGM